MLLAALLILLSSKAPFTFAGEAPLQPQDEAADPNSPEQDAWQQFTKSAKDLETAAIDDLKEAIKAAKEAGATDPKDAEGRAAKARRAHDKAIEATRKFEASQKNAKQAAGWAEELKKTGANPLGTSFTEDGYKKAIADLRPQQGAAPLEPNPDGGPELQPHEEMAQSAAELEKSAYEQLEEAAKSAKEAGALDPKNLDAINAKARRAQDQVIDAMRNFERAQRFARSAEQLRQQAAAEKKGEGKKSGFWESLAPAIAPSFGMGRRSEERRGRIDPMPGKR